MTDLSPLVSNNWRQRLAALETIDAPGAALVDGLVAVVRDRNADLSALSGALQGLLRSGVPLVELIAPLLADERPEVRMAAVLLLGETPHDDAIAPVMRVLGDPDMNVRFHAIEALGKLRALAAVDPLLALASGDDFFASFPAIDALGLIGDATVAATLVARLDDVTAGTAAAAALGRLGTATTVAALCRWVLTPPGELDIGVLALSRLQARLGEAVVMAVQRVWTPAERITVLERALAHPGSLTQPELARALAQLTGWLLGATPRERNATARALQLLCTLLDVPEARDEATMALGHAGTEALAGLALKLGSPDPDVQRAAAAALTMIGSEGAVPPLEAVLDNEQAQVAATAAQALDAIGAGSAAEPLLGHFNHPSALVRNAIAAAVFRVLPPAELWSRVEPLTRDADELVRETAVRALGLSRDVRAVEALLAALRDPVSRVRLAAVEVLPAFVDRDERAARHLEAVARGEQRSMRAAVAKALAQAPAPLAAPLLLQALDDDDPWTRFYACRSLGQLGLAPDALPRLAVLAKDSAAQVRAAVAEALSGCHLEAAENILLELLGDDESDVLLAVLAVVGLGGFERVAAVVHRQRPLERQHGE